MAFNHKRADFLAFKFWIFFSLFSLLKGIFSEDLKPVLGQPVSVHNPYHLNQQISYKLWIRLSKVLVNCVA